MNDGPEALGRDCRPEMNLPCMNVVRGHMHVEKRACRTWRLRELDRVVLLWGRFFCPHSRFSYLSLSCSSSSFLSLLAPQFSCPMHIAPRPLPASSLSLFVPFCSSALSSWLSRERLVGKMRLLSRGSVPASVASPHRRYVAHDLIIQKPKNMVCR